MGMNPSGYTDQFLARDGSRVGYRWLMIWVLCAWVGVAIAHCGLAETASSIQAGSAHPAIPAAARGHNQLGLKYHISVQVDCVRGRQQVSPGEHCLPESMKPFPPDHNERSRHRPKHTKPRSSASDNQLANRHAQGIDRYILKGSSPYCLSDC